MTTINELAKMKGMTDKKLRHLINIGKLPIAILDPGESGYTNCYLLPPKVYDYLGIKIDGYEPPPTVKIDIDYKMLAEEVAKEIAAGMAMAFKEEEAT